MKHILSFLLLIALTSTSSRLFALDGFVGDTWDVRANDEGVFNPNFGNGSQANPWKILTAEGLAYLAKMVNNKDCDYEGEYFEVAANIDLGALGSSGSPLTWVPIGLDEAHPFKGTITNGTDADGNPYVISGMSIRATGTTEFFGLFGVLQGTVEGLVIKDATIDIRADGEFHAGALCGVFGSPNRNNAIGAVRRCTADGTKINATSSNTLTSVGGLMGKVGHFTDLTSTLAKTSINATGPISAGGVFGFVFADKVISDCHAVVNITVKNETTSQASAGGITGYSYGTSCDKIELLACTASGDIEVNGDGSNIVMGGITGYAISLQKLTFCTTSVSLSGGHTMGGLIGFYERMRNESSSGIAQCFCSSFVDAKKATYAGGLFGHLAFSPLYSSNYYVMIMSNSSVFTTFAGTMTKPENSECYGIAVGYVENDKYPDQFGYFQYDRQMCNLQLNGMGWSSEKWSTGSYGLAYPFNSPKPQDGVYAYYQPAWLAQLYQHLNNREPFYTDNMKVACAPMIVTNDYKTYFNAFDVTIDFLVEKFINQTTGEELATFQLASPVPSCIKLVDNKAKLLDPGEATVIVNCRGVQRKVHLDITYGVPWDGKYPSSLSVPGSGTAKDPYVIHTAAELYRSAYSSNNKDGVHFILSNDLFINTHLLTDDEQPRDGANNWVTNNWNAILHGNGKTIYGLKSVSSLSASSSDGALSGLFRRVSGTIEDLAVVDAYVQASGSGSGISAGIICGELLKHGNIERCLVHGAVQSNGYAGAICGRADPDSTAISDCFAAAHIGWPGNPENYLGAGIVGAEPEVLTRCVSTCKVEEPSYTYESGITRNARRATDCWFDRQMMSGYDESIGSTYTKDMISGKILAGNSRWSTAANRYPMLRSFASTTYGELLAAPVFFANDTDIDEWAVVDRAGYVTQIFDLPTENIVWHARLGTQHLDVINECGAGTPNGKTSSGPDHLVAETESLASLCTRAKHCIAVDVCADKAGIRFKDSRAEAACLMAFDVDGDKLVSLREAFTADKNKFQTFNRNAGEVEGFTEMRYFAGITALEEGELSGLSHLSALELPKVLVSVGPNAFNGCSSLEEVTLPYTFRTANGESFYESGIKNIWVNERNPQCRSIDGALYQTDLFDDAKVMLMAYPPGRGEESATLSVPLTKINSKAIFRVPALNNVYIDNCLPEGEMAELAAPEDASWSSSDAIIHEDDEDDTEEPQMQIYVNDGSFNSQLFNEYNDDYEWEPYKDNDRLDIYYPLTVTTALWATLYIDFDTELPEGLTAYIASEPDTLHNIVELNSIGRRVPRSTPVAIKAEEAGIYPLYKYPTELPDIEMYKNRFIGSFIGQDDQFGVPVNQETANEGSMLTLGRNRNGQVGFFKYNGYEIPPYRAYLTRNNIIEGPTSLMVKIGHDLATEIASVHSAQPRQKPSFYTIDGRRLATAPTQRGLYIINGKKVVIK